MRGSAGGVAAAKAIAIVIIIVGAASFGYLYNSGRFSATRQTTQTSVSGPAQRTEWANFSARTFHVGCCPGYVAMDAKTGILYTTIQPGNSLYAINPGTDTVSANISAGAYPRDLVVDPANGMVYVVDQTSNGVSVIDPSAKKVIAVLPVGQNPVEIGLNPRNGLVYVAAELSNELTVIDPLKNNVTGDVALTCNGPCTNSTTGIPNSVDFDPATNTIYVANNGLNSMQVINGSTGQVEATVPVGQYPDGIAVDPDSNVVYVANMLDNSVSVVNVTNDRVLKTVNVGIHPGDAVFDQVLGDVFVADEGNNTVSVIGTVSNRLLATVKVGPPCCGPMGLTADPLTGDVYVAVPSTGNITVISKCSTKTCPTISGAAPPCGSYALSWSYPNTSPVPLGSSVSSRVSTCARGTVSWSFVSEPSGISVASGNFSCPCSNTVLFNFTAGWSPLINGTYYFQQSFNGNGMGETLAIGRQQGT